MVVRICLVSLLKAEPEDDLHYLKLKFQEFFEGL